MIDLDKAGVFMSRSGKNSWLQTSKGGRVSVLSPLTKEIDIEDIAKSLAKQCRFNGHCEEFYSVAQHCVFGVERIREDQPNNLPLMRAFLLHDASEAYVGDLIKPVKVMLPEFSAIEDKFTRVINKTFNVDESLYEQVKYYDRLMLAWEKRDFLPNSETWSNMIDISDMDLPRLWAWSWKVSEISFLECYKRLWS